MDKIETLASSKGAIEISRSPTTGMVLYELAGWGQSTADSDGVSLASYIHAIFGLIAQTKARDILLIGGAGGTLASLLLRKKRQPSIVDITPEAFTLARRHFALPDSVPCIAADGEAFLRETDHRYDAIVLDAFVGAEIPAHLQTPDFFAAARKRLAPEGAMFVNVHLKHDFDDYADRMAKAMATAWPGAPSRIRVLDALGRCPRNAIVMAGEVAALRPPSLLISPNINAATMKEELSQMAFRRWKASRWDF